MGQSISPVTCLTSADSDCTEIKNKFAAARSRLPVMFLATPKDQWTSMWTQERPSAQVSWALCPLTSSGCWLGVVPCSWCWSQLLHKGVVSLLHPGLPSFNPLTSFSPQILQRLVLLASESLRALEEQLMTPLSDQDVKVTPPGAPAQGFSGSGQADWTLVVAGMY